jgi:hypothetical protein
MRRLLLSLTLSLPLSLVLGSCSGTVYRDVYPTLSDGKYDSEFPYRNSSLQLERVADCVRMISTIAYYRTYVFPEEWKVTPETVTQEFLEQRRLQPTFVNRSMSGTATVVFARNRRVALVTCAHVVSFPDTMVSYHLGPDRQRLPYLRTIALKERQNNYVATLPEGGEMEILAMDKAADIAIVGRRFEQEPAIPIRAFPYPLGRAMELEWGSFVYLYGYPSGYRMLTKAIVSNPNRDKKGGFLLDAVFGGGFSGGVAVAIRDGVPNFEMVGMVKLVSARTSYVLAPPRDDANVEFDTTIPYAGEIFVERRTDIEYGVTVAVPAEAMVKLYEANAWALRTRGYEIDFFRGQE